jgi:hypothetical protein
VRRKRRACNDCNKRKLLDDFPRDKNRPLGRGYICKTCAVVRTRAWYKTNKKRALTNSKRWRETNRLKQRASSRKYYAKNATRLRARSRELNARPEAKAAARWCWVKRKYGLTKEQWLDIFEVQGRRCACCRSAEPSSKRGWHTDHDHKTEKLRGIVCHPCNVMLGAARDSIEILEAGKRYLRHANP